MHPTLDAVQAIDHQAWLDLFRAPPASVRAAPGLRAERTDRTLVLEAPGIDHVLFNRVIPPSRSLASC